MKKSLALILVFSLLFAFTACGGDKGGKDDKGDMSLTADEQEKTTEISTTELVTVESLGEDKDSELNILVAYFSEDDGIEVAAKAAAEDLGADIFHIEAELPYPDDEIELEKRIKEEKENGVRPLLKNNLPDTDKYDIVVLGYPVWADTLPMAVCTFIEDHDMYGKAIIPFYINESGNEANSLTDLAALCRLDKMTLSYSIADPEPAPFLMWLDSVIYG